jgi:hypothetical protein
MAKYSKKRSRKGRSRRRPYKKRRNTIKGVSRKLDKLYSAIEYKHWDVTHIDQRPTQAGLVYSLTNMPVGDGDQSRDGDKVTTTSIQFRCQIGQVQLHNLIRFVVLKVRGSRYEIAPTAASYRDLIFQSPITQGLNRPWLWKYNVDYFRSSGAKILMDSYYDLVPTSIGETSVSKNMYIKKKITHRQNMQYTTGGLRSNHEIILLVFGEQATTSFAPYFSFTTRLNYLDL